MAKNYFCCTPNLILSPPLDSFRRVTWIGVEAYFRLWGKLMNGINKALKNNKMVRNCADAGANQNTVIVLFEQSITHYTKRRLRTVDKQKA